MAREPGGGLDGSDMMLGTEVLDGKETTPKPVS